MSRSRRTPVEHSRREQAQQDKWTRHEKIENCIDGCARLLARAGRPDYPRASAYTDVAAACVNRLAPFLREQNGRAPNRYGAVLNDDAGYDQAALTWLLDTGVPPLSSCDDAAMDRVETAFRSLAAVAEHEQIISDELRNRVDVEGWTLKIGEHLQDWEMDLDAPIGGIAAETEAVKTLHCGGTGSGKSTALETEAEDFYQRNFEAGRDFKLIDLVDLDKGENWFGDIPQQQGKLRRIREEDMEMPPDFAVSDDHGTPAVDIRVPLTPNLDDQPLPYDADAEAFRVQPFVIPAAGIPKRILIPCILARVSDDQERTIRKAYDDVNRRKDDWSLQDLANDIRERDELSAKHKADAVGILQSLQDLGFIRTHEHEHTIDWEDIFTDTDRITIFSQAFVGSELGTFFSIAYLVDTILDERQDLYGFPDAVLLMRELWEVTPHKGRLSPDERAAAVQEALADRMQKVMRKLRHFDLHLIGDTQEPGDLHKSVRERFNRYVVFNGNRDTVDDVFSWTSNDRNRSFWSTLNMKKGQAGIVGKVEPAVENRDIEFISPVAYCPPAHHHYDKNHDTNGWRTRAKYLSPTEECPECGGAVERHEDRVTVVCVDEECGEEIVDPSLGREEVLRTPSDVGEPWDGEVPTELEIDDRADLEGPDVTMRPVAAFASECLEVVAEDEYEFYADIRQAFNDYLEENGRDPWDFSQQSKMTSFGDRLREFYPENAFDRKQRTPPGGGTRQVALCGLSFTDKGRRHAKAGGDL